MRDLIKSTLMCTSLLVILSAVGILISAVAVNVLNTHTFQNQDAYKNIIETSVALSTLSGGFGAATLILSIPLYLLSLLAHGVNTILFIDGGEI